VSNKPIKIVKLKNGYNVFVHDVPLVLGDNGKGVTLDRARAGLSTGNGWKPPVHTEPVLVKKKEDAIGLAHQVGRYLLNMGDMVFAYTELEGVEGSHNTWWNRAAR